MNFLKASAIDHFTDVPIKRLCTEHFDIEDGKIIEVVKTLSKMRYLESFEIVCHWSLYEMSPEEFSLFQRLPVKTVSTYALDLKTEGNLLKFRQIMMNMKIENIKMYSKEKIPVISHGPGDIYKSI